MLHEVTRKGAVGWWLGAGAALAALAVIACGSPGGAPGAGSGSGQLPPAVEALPARVGSLPMEEVLSGVARARNQVAIRPEISASVVEVLVRNGDSVERGQPLVRLDDSTLREQLRQAEASLRLARATAAEARARETEIAVQVVRTRALAADGLVSDLILETREAQLQAVQAQAAQAEARVEQATATVEEERSALARTVVRAPVPGRVGQRDVEVGMVVEPGQPLFLLGDFTDLVVEVPLTQAMLTTVEEGTAVEIELDGGGGAGLEATISRISPFLEEASFSTTAEIDVPAGGRGLRPGMFVTVRVIQGSSAEATLLPASVIWEDPRSRARTVFVVTDDDGLVEPEDSSTEIPETPRSISARPVAVVAEGRGLVGVTGVSAGEWVVTVGQHLLQERFQLSGSAEVPARVRPTSWTRVLELQGLQREDLLARFLDRQRRVAAVLGAELPTSTEAVEAALAAAERDAGGG